MIPIFVINLDRSPERWNAMKDNFMFDDLTHFKAIDGGTFDGDDKKVFEMSSPEIACAQSHIAVWQKIVANEIPMAIVLEDDVEPIYQGFSIADYVANQDQDFDVLFLQRHDIPGFPDSVVIDDKNNYIVGWGAHAYAITLGGAKKSIDVMVPIMHPVDIQWLLGFEGGAIFSNFKPSRKDIVAKALPTGIIQHSKQAAKTTFTKSGEKPWTDDRYKGGLE